MNAMFCLNLIILIFCFNLGVNLVFGETPDILEKDQGNELEFSSDSDVDQNNVLSEIAKGLPISQFSANDYDSDEVDDILHDDNEYGASRRVFKQFEGFVRNIAKGASIVANGAGKLAEGVAAAKEFFNKLRGKTK